MATLRKRTTVNLPKAAKETAGDSVATAIAAGQETAPAPASAEPSKPHRRRRKKSPIRKLTPAEFQVFIAIKELGAPTIKQLREFLAHLPPLSASIERQPEKLHQAKRAVPSYNNINTLLVRMVAIGAIDFTRPDSGGIRRLIMMWDFNETLDHCVRWAVRDYLAYQPAILRVLPAILEEAVFRYTPEDRPDLARKLHAQIDAIMRHAHAGRPKPKTTGRKQATRPLT